MLEKLYADVSRGVAEILDRALEGRELGHDDGLRLLATEGPDFQAFLRAADVARSEDKGDDVSFVVCRNVNFTNVCYVGCSFCGFARHREEEDAYDRTIDQILEKCRDAVARGATEICMQGGIDPQKNFDDYRNLLLGIKAEFPNLHIHAYSPEEMDHAHAKSGMALDEMLRSFVEAGLGTMPGTAAEILDDEIRGILAPNKLMTARWREIISAAHEIGLRSTATIMYGHIEKPRHIVSHLELIREIQKETGGFTEFVPLGFIHEKNALGHVNIEGHGPSAADDLKLIALSRLMLRPHIQNIQMSWVKMGPKVAQLALQSGANDMGGTLMEESISRESGADHGENLPAEEMRRLIREMGRTPVERSTKYDILRRFEDPEKDPPSLEPDHDREMAGPRRFRNERGLARVQLHDLQH